MPTIDIFLNNSLQSCIIYVDEDKCYLLHGMSEECVVVRLRPDEHSTYTIRASSKEFSLDGHFYLPAEPTSDF